MSRDHDFPNISNYYVYFRKHFESLTFVKLINNCHILNFCWEHVLQMGGADCSGGEEPTVDSKESVD